MRAPLIGGPRHGQSVVVTDPPLERIQVVEDGPLLWMRTDIRTEQYRLVNWINGSDWRMAMHGTYVHTSLTDADALRYVTSWFETGVIAPLEGPRDL